MKPDKTKIRKLLELSAHFCEIAIHDTDRIEIQLENILQRLSVIDLSELSAQNRETINSCILILNELLDSLYDKDEFY